MYADITSGSSYDFTPPFKIEFNFEKLNKVEANTTIRLFDQSNNHFNPWITQTGHYVIDVKANRVDWSINGQAQTGQDITLGTSFVEFLMTPNASIKFSNFMIYKLQ